jgi:actin related protein 2/3 complex subunit 3
MIGNMALLPVRSKIRGPIPAPCNSSLVFSPLSVDNNQEDIVDEAMNLFRANCFFRNFEIKGSADRVLIYLLLFIQECLGKLKPGMNAAEGGRTLTAHAQSNFVLPGEVGFPLNAVYEKPPTRADAGIISPCLIDMLDMLRQYLSQLRQEMALRLAARIYQDDQTQPSKWWMCFTKRKFMNLGSVSGF